MECPPSEPEYEVEIISATEDQIVASHVGTSLLAHRTFRELRSPVATLLSPVAIDPREMRHSPDFLGWLKEQSTKVRRATGGTASQPGDRRRPGAGRLPASLLNSALVV
jgi:hypothetical protein